MRDRHPETFAGAWGTVDPLGGEQAIEEARRAVAEHQVLGFHFHPIMGRYSVDDPRFHPLFDAISALGVPVLVDVGTTGMGAGMPGGDGALLRHAHPQAIDALARVKERRFGRLTLTISDGRVVDVEVVEKVDHDLLRGLSV